MENNVCISIIVPVFNVRHYLPEALDSVVHQTYENLDIIIIDDGSTDGSSQICDEYAKKDNRIRVIHQENKGVSAARNKGLNVSIGEYIAFLDPDDKYQEDYCQKMLQAVKQNEADMAVCKIAVCYTTGKLHLNKNDISFPAIKTGVYDREKALRMLTEDTINPNAVNKMYHSSLWKEIRFPVGHAYGEDLDISFRLIDCCKSVCGIDEVLYLRRRHDESVTRTISQKYIRDLVLAFSHYESFVESNIPNVYGANHLNCVRRSELKQIIPFYIRLSQNNGKEEKAFLKKLRKRIIKLGKHAGFQNCSKLIRIGYWMICFCPWLIGNLSAVYYRFDKK